MLNISQNSINQYVNLRDFKSYSYLSKNHISRSIILIILFLLFTFIVILFVPWTQNIRTKGYVTTRSPQQRPQSIQSIIGGRIEKWYVQEGDFVQKGDTIANISEIKSEYFDPKIITRTSEQVAAKTQSVEAYIDKINALNNQYKALQESLELKRQNVKNKMIQAQNKINIDSIDLLAYQSNHEITKNQYERTQQLYQKGLKSLSDVQDKEYKVQEQQAKVNVQKNKLLNQRNEFNNLKIDLLSVEREYAEKMSKSMSDKQSAISDKMESVAATSKLQNQLSNYAERQKLYFITAPQSGYVTKTIRKGIGETVKEGADIATLVPDQYDLAVELYVKPQDIPLLNLDNNVQLRFDGWPAVVISGWPKSSTGVFQGNVVAIDKYINDNGSYRVLVSPNDTKKSWPDQLSIGTGVQAFILLKTVPVWYEIWRQLNGFPPDFYKDSEDDNKNVKMKAPIKLVK